jgi:ankyrin repeat protein
MLEHALKLQANTELNGIPIIENTTPVADKEVELLQVTSTGNVPKIEQVLEKPNVVASIVSQKDKFGITPLHVSAHRSFDSSLVELFRKKGVVLNAKDKYGQTALHYAARYASVQTVKALLTINEELAEEARNNNSFL